MKISKDLFIANYNSVRKKTEEICQPLEIEDYVVQSIEDVSPPKWHLGHTSWFFENFILQKYISHYRCFDKKFNYIFNSYYHGVGLPFPRALRGNLSRPTVKEIYQYRRYVDEHLNQLLEKSKKEEIHPLITLGLHHEQQHQELLLMDIKYNLSFDPSFPRYTNKNILKKTKISRMKFIECKGGEVKIGYDKNQFCYDNELPRHKEILLPFKIANRLVTNKEYLEFIEEGGYQNSLWWLSDGWINVLKNGWQAPLYWQKLGNQWYVFTLHGLQKLNLDEPVMHVSYYEANAFANWKGCRLPTEKEWEHFVTHFKIPITGNFLETNLLHSNIADKSELSQFYGDAWEWTDSPYMPYPGYKPFTGLLGEYNAKFMSNQMVLKGGACVTPKDHIRFSYRNFFQPEKRWQFSGIRLAEKLKE